MSKICLLKYEVEELSVKGLLGVEIKLLVVKKVGLGETMS